MIKAIKRFFKLIFALALIIVVAVVGISMLVTKNQDENIIYRFQDYDQKIGHPYDQEMAKLNCDAIVVLGAGIYEDGTPTPMLKDRLESAISLYRSDVAKKILVTGDNGTKGHNEVKCMYDYLVSRSIPKDAIFVDHAGFSTYDSMYRAQSIFEIHRPIVVTQGYHMYRALFIGNNLGMECYGVAADQNTYGGQIFRSVREILARDKDVFKTYLKMKPTYGGSKIPITGTANGI
ncbi:MAG: YdcF family protein [Clostridia bacterium]|nr:YdcF family protein [Clostridia bacterium]